MVEVTTEGSTVMIGGEGFTVRPEDQADFIREETSRRSSRGRSDLDRRLLQEARENERRKREEEARRIAEEKARREREAAERRAIEAEAAARKAEVVEQIKARGDERTSGFIAGAGRVTQAEREVIESTTTSKDRRRAVGKVRFERKQKGRKLTDEQKKQARIDTTILEKREVDVPARAKELGRGLSEREVANLIGGTDALRRFNLIKEQEARTFEGTGISFQKERKEERAFKRIEQEAIELEAEKVEVKKEEKPEEVRSSIKVIGETIGIGPFGVKDITTGVKFGLDKIQEGISETVDFFKETKSPQQRLIDTKLLQTIGPSIFEFIEPKRKVAFKKVKQIPGKVFEFEKEKFVKQKEFVDPIVTPVIVKSIDITKEFGPRYIQSVKENVSFGAPDIIFGDKILGATAQTFGPVIAKAPVIRTIEKGREQEAQREVVVRGRIDLLQEKLSQLETTDSAVEQEKIIKELRKGGVKVTPKKTDEGITFKFEVPGTEGLRKGFETSTTKEPFTLFFKRQLRKGFEESFTDISQRTIFKGPTILEPTIPVDPGFTATAIGKTITFGAEAAAFTVPGVGEALIFGPTLEAGLGGEEKFKQFIKDEPFEVGFAAGFAVGKPLVHIAKKLKPLSKEAELQRILESGKKLIGEEEISSAKNLAERTKRLETLDLFAAKAGLKEPSAVEQILKPTTFERVGFGTETLTKKQIVGLAKDLVKSGTFKNEGEAVKAIKEGGLTRVPVETQRIKEIELLGGITESGRPAFKKTVELEPLKFFPDIGVSKTDIFVADVTKKTKEGIDGLGVIFQLGSKKQPIAKKLFTLRGSVSDTELKRISIFEAARRSRKKVGPFIEETTPFGRLIEEQLVKSTLKAQKKAGPLTVRLSEADIAKVPIKKKRVSPLEFLEKTREKPPKIEEFEKAFKLRKEDVGEVIFRGKALQEFEAQAFGEITEQQARALIKTRVTEKQPFISLVRGRKRVSDKPLFEFEKVLPNDAARELSTSGKVISKQIQQEAGTTLIPVVRPKIKIPRQARVKPKVTKGKPTTSAIALAKQERVLIGELGLGIDNLFEEDTKQIPRTKVALKTKQVLEPALKEFQKGRVILSPDVLLKDDVLLKEDVALKESQKQRVDQRTKAIQEEITGTTTVFTPRVPFTPRRKISEPPGIPEKFILFPPPFLPTKKVSKKKKGRGYNVKAKGIKTQQFIKLNKVPLSKGDAKSLGAFTVDTSLGRTFEIVPTKRKAKTPKTQFPRNYFGLIEERKLRDFRVKKGKKIGLTNKWIEKGDFLLDTKQERKKISVAKRLKQLRKPTKNKTKKKSKGRKK